MEEFKKDINENDAMQLPLVSICSITYNHAPYIRQCLDGFLMQKTNFKYEIIIHDDASTDGTAEIIKEYAEKYPDLITPIFQTENQYSKGLRGFYARFVYPRAKGKYIALCEGDDYWTDPLKLQKQVDFLESHPDYVMCWQQCKFYLQTENRFTIIYPNDGIKSITKQDFLYGLSMPQTLTFMFKKDALDLDLYNKVTFSGDLVLYYLLLRQGNGHCISDIGGVYRIHRQGIWSGAEKDKQFIWELNAKKAIYQIDSEKETAEFLLRLLEKPISRLFLLKRSKQIFSILRILQKHLGTRFLLKFLVNRYIRNKRTLI